MNDADGERLLMRLPGLSWKGARCILLYSLRRDVFPVDGNTFRVSCLTFATAEESRSGKNGSSFEERQMLQSAMGNPTITITPIRIFLKRCIFVYLYDRLF